MSGFQMPPHQVDQMAATARDAGAGPEVLDLIASSFGGVAEGCDLTAAAFPGCRLTLSEVASMMRAQRDAYQQVAAEMRKGGRP